uniref:HMG box domain-containing protein n=1 Tax=Meloidogyne incognita TaxID=6306 RepID=A0A914M932_MELIC
MNSNSEPTIPVSHSLDTNDVMKGENNNSWLPKLNAKSKRGYILFSAEVRKRVMNEIPEAKFGEVLEIIGTEWKRLSNEDKRDYESRARFIAAERAKAGLLTPNSKLPQHTITHQGWHNRFGKNFKFKIFPQEINSFSHSFFLNID